MNDGLPGAPRLYSRCHLPDGREGCYIGSSPTKQGQEAMMVVLTDDYHRVTIPLGVLSFVKRSGPGLVVYSDGVQKNKVYPIEDENIKKLHMAVWHDHWDRFPPSERQLEGVYGSEYRAGRKQALPVYETWGGERNMTDDEQWPNQVRLSGRYLTLHSHEPHPPPRGYVRLGYAIKSRPGMAGPTFLYIRPEWVTRLEPAEPSSGRHAVVWWRPTRGPGVDPSAHISTSSYHHLADLLDRLLTGRAP